MSKYRGSRRRRMNLNPRQQPITPRQTPGPGTRNSPSFRRDSAAVPINSFKIQGPSNRRGVACNGYRYAPNNAGGRAERTHQRHPTNQAPDSGRQKKTESPDLKHQIKPAGHCRPVSRFSAGPWVHPPAAANACLGGGRVWRNQSNLGSNGPHYKGCARFNFGRQPNLGAQTVQRSRMNASGCAARSFKGVSNQVNSLAGIRQACCEKGAGGWKSAQKPP